GAGEGAHPVGPLPAGSLLRPGVADEVQLHAGSVSTEGGGARRGGARCAEGARVVFRPARRKARAARRHLATRAGMLRAAMSWKPEADEIERRRALARAGGGAEATAKQHARGRLTVRERIARLVDPGSFREHGDVAGAVAAGGDGAETFTPANVVVGSARLDGRHAVVAGDDFTIKI